jgi:hypothetical protein
MASFTIEVPEGLEAVLEPFAGELRAYGYDIAEILIEHHTCQIGEEICGLRDIRPGTEDHDAIPGDLRRCARDCEQLADAIETARKVDKLMARGTDPTMNGHSDATPTLA